MGLLNEKRDGNGDDDEKPAHEVRMESLFIGKYQVTFQEYDAFCEATGREKPEDRGWGRGRRPVIYVDWYDAVEYCNWLNEIWGLEKVYEINKGKKDPNNKKWLVTINENANGYRLPTEAEWEYAARGGQQSKDFTYAGSNNLDEVGWYGDNSGGKTHPVGEKKPNELGLYDMSGNVYEWCWDWFDGDYYQPSPKDDPHGPESGSYRVIRGGYWALNARACRVADRDDGYPARRSYNVGFRLVRSS
jgi:sulfatase modifying factor 1